MNEEVARLFHALADLPPDARDRYFESNQVPGALRAEVEALLSFDGPAPVGAVHRDISLLAAEALAAGEMAADRQFERIRCGAFRLREVIGRGGMGVVYLGERDDGEVTQRAAVKLPRGAILDGFARARFLRERQILAAMSHPNIARLLDAGHLDDGQPFLAMEFVEGETIDRFAEGLPLREKLELIIKVAGAVSYLHRNLVVHRDLKPGNILVTAGGEPKLLDFGIAKILDLAQDVTMTAHRMLTPGFASPEQLLGEPIGTASDVYSLAAVLYYLLTGRTPGESTAPAVEVIKPGKWAPGLDTDVEMILMKALRREPAERYGTADAFADDLRAFLDSRPVSARKRDWIYRARKVARRYWLPAGAVALMIAGLSAGLIIANRQRQIAEQRFNDVRQLSARLFDIDDLVLKLPNAAEARQLIVNTSLDYLGRLRAGAASNPGLALELGSAYMRVAQVQGMPLVPNLGQAKNAAENLRIAEELIESVLRAEPSNRKAMLRRAEILHDRMSLAENDAKGDPLPLARSAESWLQKYMASGVVDRTNASLSISLGTSIANRYQMQEENGEAIRLLDQLEKLSVSSGVAEMGVSLRITLARVQRRIGDLEAALATIQEATRQPPPAIDKSSPEALRRYRLALSTEGTILFSSYSVSLDRDREAVEVLARARKIGEELIALNPNSALIRMAAATDWYRLADALGSSDPERALALLEQAVEAARQVKQNQRALRELARHHAAAAEAALRLRRMETARRHASSAFDTLRNLGTYPAKRAVLCEEVCLALRARGKLEAAGGRMADAAGTFRELLLAVDNAGAKPERSLDQAMEYAAILSEFAGMLARSGDAPGKADLLARREALWRHWERTLPGNRFVQRQLAARR